MPLLAYREKSSIVPPTPPLALHLPRAATGTWISDSRMSRYGAGLTEKLRLGPANGRHHICKGAAGWLEMAVGVNVIPH
jgi:hypothetical protein